MKKLFLFLTCLMAVTTSLWAYDFSAVCETEQTLYYNINSDGTSVSVTYPKRQMDNYYYGYSRPTGNLVIPSSVTYGKKNYSVTTIKMATFSACTGLTSVTIPNSVTFIEYSVFAGCTGLTAINVADDNTSYKSIDGVLYLLYTNNETILMCYPAGKQGGFSIPNSVASIAQSAFSYCTGLTEITIPNSVTSIGYEAFYKCTGLTEIAIPNSVTSIGTNAFGGCSGLTGTLTIPNSVTSIGSHAFKDCTGLTSVTIPNSVTSIGIQAFSNCTGLTSVTIPNSVTSIGESAFSNCTGLTSVTIPNSVTSIGEWAFYNCTGITGINVAEDNTYYKSIDGVLYSKNGYTLIWYPQGKQGGFSIPNTVTTIGNQAFCNCTGLTSVTIPNSITSIGDDAFSFCTGLTSIICNATTPPTITEYTFIHYTPTLYVPSGSVSDYENADYWKNFSSIQPLYTITATSANEAMGSVSGGGTYEKNETATLTATSTTGYHFVKWNEDDNTDNPREVTVTQDSAFTAVFAINNYTVTATANNASYGNVTGGGNYNHGLTATLTATPNLKYGFDKWDDDNTDNPRNVVVTQDSTFTAVFSARRYDFEAVCESGQTLYYNINNNGTSVTLTYPNGNTTFLNELYVGYNQPTGSLVIPSSVTYNNTTYTVTAVGDSTFCYCSEMTSVSIPTTVTSIGNYAFYATGLAAISIPNSVTTIGDNAFFNCSSANNLVIGDAVTGIGTAAFGSCSGLTSVTIPNSVTTISQNAFRNCSGVTTLTIGSAVESIGTQVFYGCTGLTNIICNAATPPSISNNTFANYNASLLVPASSAQTYKTTSYWKKFDVQPYFVTVAANDAGMGNVSGGGTYEKNATATLTATPTEHYHFVKWNEDNNTDNPRNVTVTKDSTFTAVFALNNYTITANVNIISAGTVTGGDNYDHGSTAKLTATPTTGYHFVKWNEDDNTDNPRNVVVTQDSAFTAVFALNNYTVTANVNDNAMGSVTGGGNYNHGSMATLTPTPTTGHHFVKWEEDNNTDNPRSFEVTQDSVFTAVFAINNYTVTANVNIISAGTVTGGNNYDHGSTATLTATPTTGYHFVKWLEDDNTDNPRNVVVTQDSTFTAVFLPVYTVTAKTDDASYGTVTGSNTYVSGTTATLTATPKKGYSFEKWNEDGNTVNPRNVVVTQDSTFTAVFLPIIYNLNVLANNNEMGTVTGGGEYAYGSKAKIEAFPKDGYTFVRWSDNELSSSRTIKVTEPKTLYAIFAIRTYRITAKSNDSNKGTVTGGGTYEYNATATLTATPKEGCHFEKWSNGSTENPLTITVTKNDVFSAVFGTKTCKLEAVANDVKMGSIAGNTGEFEYNTTVTLTAIAKSGYKFVDWEDGTTDEQRTIKLTQDTSLVANFEPVVYTIATDVNDMAMGSVEGAGDYAYGATATLKATANVPYRFIQWNDGNKDNPRYIFVSDNATYTATFQESPFMVKVNLNSKQGKVEGVGNYNYNSMATLTVTPAEGFLFESWEDGNTDNPRTITVTQDTVLNVKMMEAKPFTENEFFFEITSVNPATVKVIPQNARKPYYTTEPSGDVVIPETIEHNGVTYTITGIGEMAFRNCKNITSITLPATITTIDDYAFTDCNSLTTINIPASVKHVGKHAFRRCAQLTEAPMGEGLETISDYAYCNLNVETFVIPANVTKLGFAVFRYANKLKKIVCNAVVPPTTDMTGGEFSKYDIPLYVPASSINDYKNHAEWGKFKEINAIE